MTANWSWDFLDDVKRLEAPGDLDLALSADSAVWNTNSRSVKHGTLEWIKAAKTEATRAKRIKDVAESATADLRPSIFRH